MALEALRDAMLQTGRDYFGRVRQDQLLAEQRAREDEVFMKQRLAAQADYMRNRDDNRKDAATAHERARSMAEHAAGIARETRLWEVTTLPREQKAARVASLTGMSTDEVKLMTEENLDAILVKAEIDLATAKKAEELAAGHQLNATARDRTRSVIAEEEGALAAIYSRLGEADKEHVREVQAALNSLEETALKEYRGANPRDEKTDAQILGDSFFVASLAPRRQELVKMMAASRGLSGETRALLDQIEKANQRISGLKTQFYQLGGTGLTSGTGPATGGNDTVPKPKGGGAPTFFVPPGIGTGAPKTEPAPIPSAEASSPGGAPWWTWRGLGSRVAPLIPGHLERTAMAPVRAMDVPLKYVPYLARKSWDNTGHLPGLTARGPVERMTDEFGTQWGDNITRWFSPKP